MNSELQQFARNFLKNNLSQLSDKQITLFRLMYSHSKPLEDINNIVNNIHPDKLDWAMTQLKNTISLNEKCDFEFNSKFLDKKPLFNTILHKLNNKTIKTNHMNQVPSVTLQTAVLMQVREFANASQEFSIHNITTALRDKTSQGDLEIPEAEVSGTSFKYNILHTEVKSIFDELWRVGAFASEFNITRKFNGLYFTYRVHAVNNSSNTPSISSATTPAVSTPTPVATTSLPLQGNTPTKVSKDVITFRVAQYLENCEAKNFRPTLKQVQSAIKRNDGLINWTCGELQTLIESELGYQVIPSPDAMSTSQVAVV